MLFFLSKKGEIPKLKKDNVTYRSFQNFDHEKFLQELKSEQLDVITEHSNVETAYHNFLLVKITSISVGKASFVKHVVFFIKFEKSKIVRLSYVEKSY
jgi:hypothetical protein